MPKPRVGDPMPHFELASSSGQTFRSRDLLGRGPLVIYFYPQDDTAGCTAEACAFRDRHDEFLAAGATVVGISPDSVTTHQGFAARQRLPFPLLSDPEKKVFALYGVEDVLGMITGRETFVMDRTGVIRHHHRSLVRPVSHVREALAAVRAAEERRAEGQAP